VGFSATFPKKFPSVARLEVLIMNVCTRFGLREVGLGIVIFFLLSGVRNLPAQDGIRTFAGSIEKIDGMTVILGGIGANKEQVTVSIDEKTEISLDGKKTTLQDLKPGQTAQISQENGKTTKLEAANAIKQPNAKSMYYTVDWSKWVKPGDGESQIIIVIHNSPRGDYEVVIQPKADQIPIYESEILDDGTEIRVSFVETKQDTVVPKRLKIKSVQWNNQLVSATDPNEKAKESKPKDTAAAELQLAKLLLKNKSTMEKAKERLKAIIQKYPDSKAAEEAKKLLEE
jgi:hypothetical protein